jgi:hypothetical protein
MSHSFATKPDRGGCLNLWLGASVLFGILALFLLLGVGGELDRRGYGFLFILSLAAIVVDLVCIYGIYQWKRWGVIGLVATSLINLAFTVMAGIATATTCVSPFVQIAILWYLVHDKWDVFE